jgi:hypothetical protein
MPRQKKVSFNQKLASYDVLIEDTSLDSEYFKVSQFPTGFSGGRNGFLLAGTPFLVPNSRILVEVVNVDGQTIYQEPVKNYTEGNSKLISFEVYENTPPGLYKVILLGQARFFKNGSPVPETWDSKYNVRWSRDIIVEPLRRNTSPIRFKSQPRIFIEEEKIISIPSTTYVTDIDSGSQISLTAKYESTLPYGYNIKLLSGSTFLKTPEDFKNLFFGVITGSISASVNGKNYTSEVNLPLQKLINSTTGESTGSLIVLDSIVETLLLKSGSYIYTSPQSATQYEITSSIQLEYSYIAYDEDTVLDTGSYAKLRVVDLGTSTGEVYKTEISYKVPGTSAEYIAVSSPKVIVPELLVSASDIGDEYWIGTFISGGLHGGAHNTETHWYAQPMPASVSSENYQPLNVPTTYFTASDGFDLLLDSSKIINGIQPVIPTTTTLGVTSISPYVFGTKDSYTLFASSEYTLGFTALFSAYTGSTKLTNIQDSEVYVYLVSTPTDRILETNELGQLITKIKINNNVEQQYFENIIVNFNPKVLDFGKVSLRFIATNGFWQFSNISIKPAEEFAFNPDETTIIVPNYIDGQTLSYAARFFDINGNSTKIEVESTPITFDGPRKYVKRSGDDMYGELYINEVPIRQHSLESAFTGLLSGGVININPTNSASYDITAGYGYVVDNFTNPLEPTYKLVSWSKFEGITPAGLGTNPRTNIAITNTGQIYEQSDAFNDLDYRKYIVLGRLAHVGTPFIQRALSLPLTVYNRHFHWFDLASAISPLNVVGNVYSPSGSSMRISKSSGETYRIGSNYRNDSTFPDITADTAINTVNFAYRWRSGSTFAEAPITTIVTSSLYDNGSGTLAAVQNNRFTVQRIYFFGATNTTRIQFGQNIYNSMAEAISVSATEVFQVDPNLQSDATFRGFMIVKGDATNLSNPLQATFIPVSQFGATGGAGGGGASSLATLTDVELTLPLNNKDVLTYNSSINEWINSPVFPYTGSADISGSLQIVGITPSSNIFGDNINDLHIFTGSVRILGGVNVNGTVTASAFNGSLSYNFLTNVPSLFSASSQVQHNSTTGYVANEHIDHTTVSISAGSGLTGGGTIAATRTLTLDTGSTHFTGGVTTRVNALGVFSSSAQVSYTGLSSIPSGIVSSSTQIPALLPNGTVSASSQVAHNSTTGYVANEHIDHTTVSISAGSGLTGGGTIAATRTLTLDTGSTHFTGGVTTRVNALGVYSSSAQLVVSAYTNATDNRVITSTGAGGINAESNLTFDGDTLNVNGDLTATTKSFLINHPIKQNHKLRYGSLESPYHGIRLTGEGIVTGGKCQINLPDYIGSFVHEDGVNIQLTGVGHNKVLWVSTIDLEHNTFIVKAKIWLFDKKDYKFFWTFTAIRKDIDDLLVEYESK